MIRKFGWLNALIFAFVVGLAALLYWLTLEEPADPCADAQTDISAAVLGDETGDQEALVNRAIIMRGACDKKSTTADEAKGEEKSPATEKDEARD